MHAGKTFFCITNLCKERRLPSVMHYATLLAMHSKEALIAEFQRLMTKTDWSKSEAARALDLDASTVVRYMKPIKEAFPPSMTVLRLFSRTIGVPLQLPGESVDPWLARGSRAHMEPWEEDAVGVLRRVDPARRKDVTSALRMLLEAVLPPLTYPPPADPQSERDKIKSLAAEIVELAAATVASAGHAIESNRQGTPKLEQVAAHLRTTAGQHVAESQPEPIAKGVGQKRSHPAAKKS